MSTDDFLFRIDVPVRNKWENVNLLVLSIQHCFSAMFADVAGSHQVAMVTGELLENAIKYGSWTTGETQHLRLTVAGSPGTASIRVENPSEEGMFGDLQRTLRWAEGFPDAEAAYRARLLAIAQTADPDVSKLGIVRIAHEGRSKITAEYVGGIVSVTAEIKL